MSFSLFQLASMVQNNVSGGLRGQQNFTYSMEQLMDELTLERNGLLKDWELAGKKVPLDACSQRLDGLVLSPADYTRIPAGLPELAGLEDQVRRPVLHFTLPRLLATSSPEDAVRYIGAVQRRQKWDLATKNTQVEFREHTRIRSPRPLVYIDGTDGWVLGCRTPQRTVSLTAVFENPRIVGAFHDESEYPMTDPMARDAVQKLTNKYISMYGRLAVTTNDGTAKI